MEEVIKMLDQYEADVLAQNPDLKEELEYEL